jgi:predicted RNA-binding Zn-ribbon protein involved in translation (DUF1610 family)
MKNQITTDRKVPDKLLPGCPHCGSGRIWRIQRSLTEKIIYVASAGKFAAKKYVCQACRSSYLVHANGEQVIQGTRLVPATNPLMSCAKCGIESFTIATVTPEEIMEQQQLTGKIAFRKLICNSCGELTVIYQEDYQAANEKEI